MLLPTGRNRNGLYSLIGCDVTRGFTAAYLLLPDGTCIVVDRVMISEAYDDVTLFELRVNDHLR